MILLVEDNTETLRLFSHVLRDMGYAVLEAENGGIAKKIIDEKHNVLDLVVTDIKMPEVDGVTLVEHLRGLNPNVPVVVMSAYLNEENRLRLQKLNITHVLEKPFRIKDLENIISKLNIEKSPIAVKISRP
ncbi:response regulator [Oscillatoria amoena NRMC-F 0135]|nr:response regulator [Oscillatoria amoena NRMC-F 0135]